MHKRGPDECWPWTGHRSALGYGRIQNEQGTRPLVASRAVWELAHGMILPGFFVCHTCDNPPCCNLAHLFLGTHKDNMADQKAKGRHFRGETAPGAKLNESDVLEIRRLACAGLTSIQIAPKFRLHPRTVRNIVKGDRWAHLPL